MEMFEMLINRIRENEYIINVNNANLECTLKISFMMRWNSEGVFFKPKGITFHSY